MGEREIDQGNGTQELDYRLTKDQGKSGKIWKDRGKTERGKWSQHGCTMNLSGMRELTVAYTHSIPNKKKR